MRKLLTILLFALFAADGALAQSSVVVKHRSSGTVATPSYDHDTGTYNNDQNVTVTVASPSGSTILYCMDTTNTCDPTAGTTYSTPVTVSAQATAGTYLRSIGEHAGYTNSAIKSADYTYTAANPSFDIGGGAFNATQSVGFSDATTGQYLCYTTDGTTPAGNGSSCSNGTHPAGNISVTATEKVTMIATKTNYNSSATRADYWSITAGNVAYVGSGATSGGTNTIGATWGAHHTVVLCSVWNDTANSRHVTNITSALSLTINAAGSEADFATHDAIQCWFIKDTGTGGSADTITVTWDTLPNNTYFLWYVEDSGFPTPANVALDGTPVTASGSGTSVTTGNLTTSNAGSMLFAMVGWTTSGGGMAVAPGPFAKRSVLVKNLGVPMEIFNQAAGNYSVSATLNQSQSWGVLLFALHQ